MSDPLRAGIWAPVHRTGAALQDPAEPFDESWQHNRSIVVEAEQLGFDSMVAQHTVNPHLPESDQPETWTAVAAIAALTKRIELIAAIKPRLFHPVVLTKMALQIANISGGWFGLNLVNAWNKAPVTDAAFLTELQFTADWLTERKVLPEKVVVTDHFAKH